MKRITLLILISQLILVMACKKKSPEGSCADPVTQTLEWDKKENKPPWEDPTFTTFMEEGQRFFQIETPVYGKVCPLKDVYGQAKDYVFKPYPEGSSIWVVFKYRYGDMMDHGNSAYDFSPDGNITHFDFSIQDAYPTGAGAFYIIIQWKMISPTSDPDADFAYFKEAFWSTALELNYISY